MTKRNKQHNKQTDSKPQEILEEQFPPVTSKPSTEPISPKNETQRKYINAIRNFPLTFGVGPAGTGKTWLGGALAAQMLEAGTVERIIVTRPAVEAGESLGFLPGELEEKYDPFIAPFRAVLEERLGRGAVEYLLKSGRLEAAPLAYMRGRTFKDAFVILDEAQNTTPRQMKLFLSRIGVNCKTLVDGDPLQCDLDIRDELGHRTNGLIDAVCRLAFIPAVKVINFKREDIVRSGLVQEVIEAYECPIAGIAAW